MEASMDLSMVAMHLEPYGYMASSAEEWQQPDTSSESRPRLRLSLGGHSEKEGHTYYTTDCELSAERWSLHLEWQSQKRLAKLREELHDTVKNELGKDYPEVFALAPFAKRGGWHGTSERLTKWLETLADCINQGVASPVLVSQILLFFDAPAQAKHQVSAHVVHEDSFESPAAEAEVPSALEENSSNHEASGSADKGAPPPGESSDSNDKIEGYPSTEALPLAPIEDLQTGSASSTSTAKTIHTTELTDCGKDDTVNYLLAYGYAGITSNASAWCDVPASCSVKPMLRLGIGGHHEQEGHTYYSIECELSGETPLFRLDWKVHRRLAQLREDLHSIVKDGLGKSYAEVFSQAPFARRGGVSGTTGRLQTWLDALVSCINERVLPPSLLARVLQFLETPPPAKRRGPATPQMKIRSKVIPHGQGEALPSPQLPPPHEDPRPSELPPVRLVEGRCDAACSPIKPEPVQEVPIGPQESSDDEDPGEGPAQFSQAKRRNGYRKLRDWFVHLKRSIEKKLLDT